MHGSVDFTSKKEEKAIGEEVAYMRTIKASIARFEAEIAEAKTQAANIFAAYNV